jgi:phospholipid-binding lipoprotein MlaA
MRTWLSHGAAVAAAVGIALCVGCAPGTAKLEADPHPPSGEITASSPLDYEPDPLFDDEFEAEFELEGEMARSDPFENTNRRIFKFNRGVHTWVFDPITRGYRFVVPRVARKGLRRVFLNLNSPKVFANDLFQLRFKDAAQTLGRLVLNSTLGLGGLLDPGEAAGWERHDADFGETLAKMGVASGPYIVIPVFGPSTVRDGIGSIVDLAFQPLTYILGPGELIVQLYIGGGNGLTAFDANIDKLEALEVSSVDFYAALRSAYLQHRRASIEGLDAPVAPVADEAIVPSDEPVVEEAIVPSAEPVVEEAVVPWAALVVDEALAPWAELVLYEPLAPLDEPPVAPVADEEFTQPSAPSIDAAVEARAVVAR